MSNVNKALPEVEIDFRGEKKKLVFSTKVFCMVEGATGLNTFDNTIWGNLNVTSLTAVIWAALAAQDPKITIDEVRDNMSLAELRGIVAEVGKGFRQAMPDEKKSDELPEETQSTEIK